ncbi:response regulator transcription factor [Paenibacillus sp. JX-17]|uniref:Response regulator transcription factor n=1 Tax=Paenibacillus lacisoli TaxID=3064525 RepID=A0ABT9CGK9_9BACL|nr:response regulator transcription factor [Paenibacillus sp. JX-17]MDO7906748.1 response regulator transcription factor [Paenibacillus sp. JX-17]
MDKLRVLVTDDEQSISGAIAYALGREGFEVETALNGEEALQKVDTLRPHVLILDVMMPVMNGYDVCRALINRPGPSPAILLLTVKNDIVDKVLGLELGADDFMTKPFDIREVTARVKALARRMAKGSYAAESSAPRSVSSGRVTLIPDSRQVLLDDNEVELTPKEFDLLALLLTNPQKVYSRDDLLDLVWGMDYAGGTRTVDIHVQRLRKKIEDTDQRILQTVYGVGYKAVQR